MRIALISGSLRAESSNAAMLRAAAALAPSGSETYFVEIEPVPHFNPDLDSDDPPAAVVDFRAALASADAVIFSTPEYVHSMPGALKDALDWVVSSAELFEKPVILLNPSPNAGQRGQAALAHTLKIMTANVLDDASLADPFVPRRMDTAQLLDDVEVRAKLQAAVDALVTAVMGGTADIAV
ncbi:MAG: NAD(P)H-dependent oxidoreductase [bacterium]